MKILYVATISDTINGFMIPHIEMLLDKGHDVDIACNVKEAMNSSLVERGCNVFDMEFQRSPIKKENYISYKELKKVIVEGEYDLVHTHTPIASAIVRLACKDISDVKVVYTAHGFHFFKGAPLINWIVYYPVEYFLSKYTDTLITMNNEDYKRAKKSFNARTVEHINGVGIDIGRFNDVEIDRASYRKELGVPEDAFIALSIGELNKNKNHEVVIRSLKKLNNPEIHYIICGGGPLEDYLKSLIKELELENQVHLLGFRPDIPQICKSSDIFVFPSFREGLPVSIMEAMVTGLPIVCSNIRGSKDLVQDEHGGCLVDPGDKDGFAKAIEKLYSDEALRKRQTLNGFELVKKYSIENVLIELEDIYKNQLGCE